MIDRSEVLSVAAELSLSPDVVEKDYVLGWLLAGIYAHEDLAPVWIFKGGTCLKKCYFETYRFSEDLDFTLINPSHLDADLLGHAFREIAARLYEETGIEIPADELRFKVYTNRRGGLSAEGRLYYNGPLRRSRNLPRIKLDLTADEVLVLPPTERPVGHPYSDLPEDGILARCYAYEEVFGEKVRALAERTRPRDLYDVVNLFRHGEFRPAAAAIRDVLRRKCAFKGIQVPTLASLAAATDELIADWQAMLGHQLPVLPPFEAFWAVLPEFFAWLETGTVSAVPAAAPATAGEEVFRPAVGLLRRQGALGYSHLEIVRFAAANRLCVDLTYQGTVRRVEPYSLRRTRAGDILLFAVRAADGESRSYRLDRIQSARVTSQSFAPRYAIELAPTELGAVPPPARGGRPRRLGPVAPRLGGAGPVTRPAVRPKAGTTYIYECSFCRKRFRRSKPGGHLGPHKTPGGWPCPGRVGHLISTQH